MNFVEQSGVMRNRERGKGFGINFVDIPLGKSILFKINEVNENSIRTAAGIANKTLKPEGKIIKVVKHKKYGIFEIGCIVYDNSSEVIPDSYEQSPEMKGE